MSELVKSSIKSGNLALRNKNAIKAIRNYLGVLVQQPGLAKLIKNNLNLAHREIRRQRKGRKQSVAVCGWELSHNAAGRVYTLAELYKSFSDVEIIGTIFPEYGNKVWFPISNTNIPIHYFVINQEKDFFHNALSLVSQHPYDIIHLSKPRITNIFFGVLYQAIWDAKVIVDIDDEELAFFGIEKGVNFQSYYSKNDLPLFKDFSGKEWTKIAVSLVKEFDGVTVSNSKLQQAYGGNIIPHARNEKRFIPSSIRSEKNRKKFGIEEEKKVVLFFGSPKRHKGLLEIAQAISQLKRTNVVFVIVGEFLSDLDKTLKQQLNSINNIDIRFFKNQLFSEIPEIVSLANVCVLFQDVNDPVSKYQTPAKLSDALGMSVPVLMTKTPATEEWFGESELVQEVTSYNLKQKLDEALACDRISSESSTLFKKQLAYSVVSLKLEGAVKESQIKKTGSSESLSFLLMKCPKPLNYLSRFDKREYHNDITNLKTQNESVGDGDFDSNLKYIRYLNSKGDWGRAAKLLRAIYINDNYQLDVIQLVKISKQLFQLDDFNHAAKCLSIAEKKEPENILVLHEKANQYYYHCYSSWLMDVTENEPDWYKVEGLGKRPNWKTACQLFDEAEKVSTRQNLRHYVQAYLLLAEEGWDNQNYQQAHDALKKALSVVSSKKLDKQFIVAILQLVEQFRKVKHRDEQCCKEIIYQIQNLPLDMMEIEGWLCLHDILNWNGLLQLGYIARQRALQKAHFQTESKQADSDVLQLAVRAAFDQGELTKASQYIDRLSKFPKTPEIDELSAVQALLAGDFEGFRQQWPYPPQTKIDKAFSSYLKGKSVAVVGPAPTGSLDGKEIDSFDVVVRINWRGIESLPNPEEFGKRTDIALYNAHTIRFLIAENRLDLVNDLAFCLIRRQRYDFSKLSWVESKVRLLTEYPTSFYKSLNAVPGVLFDLLLCEVARIKVFKVNFYLGYKHHNDGYRSRRDEDFSKYPLRKKQPIIANHDLVGQVVFVGNILRACKNVEISNFDSTVLLNRSSNYIKLVESNIFDNEEIPNNPQMKLNRDLKIIKSKKRVKISIVGNSPILKRSSLGQEIDDADLVVRINNYVTHGYEKDVGRKIDLAIVTPATMPNQELFTLPMHRIIALCNDKFEDLELAQKRMKKENGCQLNINEIVILEADLLYKLAKEINLGERQWPSTGMLAIYWCLKEFINIQTEIRLFGFSFFKESADRLQHYYGVTTKRDKHHDFEAEERWIRRLHKAGLVELVNKNKTALPYQNEMSAFNSEPDVVVASHYDRKRSTSPCVSVYHAFLNNTEYKGEVKHLYTKASKKDYHNNLNSLLRKKHIFLFNGICSYLQNDYVTDSFEHISKSGSTVGIYWHETAWNINKFMKMWPKSWEKSIYLFKKYDVFHLVPTSQNKQLVMFLTGIDIERIRVVFETIPNKNYLKNKKVGCKNIIGSGIPDARKGFDIFIKLSNDPALSEFNFIWHWHESLEKVKKKYGSIGKVKYKGFVDDFGKHVAENADLFLLTSRDDPSPIVGLEALRSDVPVICFDSTGYAEVLPKEFISHGYVDMRNKILKYFNNLNAYDKGFFKNIYLRYTPNEFLKKAALIDFC